MPASARNLPPGEFDSGRARSHAAMHSHTAGRESALPQAHGAFVTGSLSRPTSLQRWTSETGHREAACLHGAGPDVSAIDRRRASNLRAPIHDRLAVGNPPLILDLDELVEIAAHLLDIPIANQQ